MPLWRLFAVKVTMDPKSDLEEREALFTVFEMSLSVGFRVPKPWYAN